MCRMLLDNTGANYIFQTEVPGDESQAGWGPDDAPHFHYDIRCRHASPIPPLSRTFQLQIQPTCIQLVTTSYFRCFICRGVVNITFLATIFSGFL